MVNETAPLPRRGSSQVKGFFRTHGQLVSGWALDRADLDRKLDVEIFVDGRSVGFARADRFDASVQAQYGGDGAHAFSFYFTAPDEKWIEGEVLAKVVGSAEELRTKNSRIASSEERTARLEIAELGLTCVSGRAPGYPPVGSAALEFWSGDQRVMSGIPLRWDDSKERRFSADLPPEAARWIVSEGAELALPGLKEASLAFPVEAKLRAAVHRVDDKLLIELVGELQLPPTLNLTVELMHNDCHQTVVATIASAGKASCDWPEEVPVAGSRLQVSIGGHAIATTFGRELGLDDLNFATLSHPARRSWQLSDRILGERGFYAFPAELASELGLSGHFAHLWREPGQRVIQLSQQVPGSFALHDRLCKSALMRARKGTNLVLRVADDAGLLGEVLCPARGEERWVPLSLDVELPRDSEGYVRFEIEAEGDGDELEVALGNSAHQSQVLEEEETPNLLANDQLTQWPFGAAVLRHTVRGEVCEGWRLFNRKCQTPMFSRAVINSSDGSIGLAVAAPDVPNYVRLEADLSATEVESRDTTLSFQAGVSPGARRLLSQSTEPVPPFTIINRIYLLRRTRNVVAGEMIDKDEIVSSIARRVPVGWQTERHSFHIACCGLPDLEDELPSSSSGAPASRTYHLVFEFRSSAVIEMSDVEIVRGAHQDFGERDVLVLEDRNIQLQAPMLKSLEHWLSPIPNMPAARPAAVQPPLKWSSEASREVVEIVVPVHNALDETMECLGSLSRSTTVPILVRVIDDGSDSAVGDALDAYAWDKPWIHVHHLGRNRGYTFAADFGIRAAQSSWAVLLNSDTVTTEGWLEGMFACARSDPRIAFVGPLSNAATYQSVPRVYDVAGKFKVNDLPVGASPDDVARLVRRLSRRDYPDAPLLNGFCTLMNRSVFLEVGGLNHGAFPSGYGEENDLCIRVRKSGWRLAIADDVYVFHHKSASFGNARRSELSKAGSTALRKLHPDVDIQALTNWFKEIPALNAVRLALASELDRGSAAHPPIATNDPLAAADAERAGRTVVA